MLAGRGEGSRLLQVGLSEVDVLLRKIESDSAPRLYALAQIVDRLAQSEQPLVPERVFMAGGAGDSANPAGQGVRRTACQPEPTPGVPTPGVAPLRCSNELFLFTVNIQTSFYDKIIKQRGP